MNASLFSITVRAVALQSTLSCFKRCRNSSRGFPNWRWHAFSVYALRHVILSS